MNYACGAKCYNCGKEWELNEFSYLCPDCGENLGIIYDYDQISKVCDKEYFKQNKDYSIWRYLPLLPVERHNRLTLQIGWTPLYKVSNKDDFSFYIKDEGRNPSASFKDRASAIALVNAIEKGAKLVTGASTGNAGSSMACLCANAGMPAYIFVPHKAPEAKIAQLLIFGAQVFGVKGTYDQAFDLCSQISEKFSLYNRNTGYNPYTREGKKTCSFEICEQLNWKVADWVVVSVGDGNIISGIWKGFCDLKKIGMIDHLPKIAGIQSSLSNAIYKTVNKYKEQQNISVEKVTAMTVADSISVDFPRDGIAAVKAIVESKGIALEVSDEEILNTIKTTANNWGIFGEPAGVTSIAGLMKMKEKNIIKDNEVVVSVMTGNGLKDIVSAMKVAGSPKLIDPDIEEAARLIGTVWK